MPPLSLSSTLALRTGPREGHWLTILLLPCPPPRKVLIRLLDDQDYDLILERCTVIVANLAEKALNRYHLRAEVTPLTCSALCAALPFPISRFSDES